MPEFNLRRSGASSMYPPRYWPPFARLRHQFSTGRCDQGLELMRKIQPSTRCYCIRHSSIFPLRLHCFHGVIAEPPWSPDGRRETSLKYVEAKIPHMKDGDSITSTRRFNENYIEPCTGGQKGTLQHVAQPLQPETNQ